MGPSVPTDEPTRSRPDQLWVRSPHCPVCCSAMYSELKLADLDCVCVCSVVSRYFFKSGEGSADVYQGGVFRINCMDSLDRTNVVQSMLARRMLQKQLLVRLDLLPLHILAMAHQPHPTHTRRHNRHMNLMINSFSHSSPHMHGLLSCLHFSLLTLHPSHVTHTVPL